MFNVLAFPLVLGVGVDYGIYIVIAMRAGRRPAAQPRDHGEARAAQRSDDGRAASVRWASRTNPALRGLGVVCALGVAWCLFATLFFVLPAYAWRGTR